jgi:cell division protein FtsZ
VIDPEMRDETQLTVIATGFDRPKKESLDFVDSAFQRPRNSYPNTSYATNGHTNGREPAKGTAGTSRDTAAENGRGESAKQQADYNVRTFDRDDLDIPAFLRRQQRSNNGR